MLTEIGGLRTLTPVWIHPCIWNGAQSLKQHRRYALLFFRGHPSNFEVTRDKKSPILTRIEHFQTVAPVWIRWWLWNDAQSLIWYRRGGLLFFEVLYQVSRSHGLQKIDDLNPIWVRLLGRLQLSNPSDLSRFLLSHGWKFEFIIINVLDFSYTTFLLVYPAESWRPLCWAPIM